MDQFEICTSQESVSKTHLKGLALISIFAGPKLPKCSIAPSVHIAITVDTACTATKSHGHYRVHTELPDSSNSQLQHAASRLGFYTCNCEKRSSNNT